MNDEIKIEWWENNSIIIDTKEFITEPKSRLKKLVETIHKDPDATMYAKDLVDFHLHKKDCSKYELSHWEYLKEIL